MYGDLYFNCQYVQKSLLCFIKGIDMALLSFANHSIITYGTFAMWSALFSRKGEVVMPEDHVKTELGRKIQMAKIPNWNFI